MSLGHAFKAKRMTVTMILVASSLWPAAASTQNVWTSHGPYGGTITALAIDPQTSTTLYAGTLVGGVYKSADGGESWQAINNGLVDVGIRRSSPTSPYVPTDQDLARLHVTALAIDPLTPTTVYAGNRSGEVFKSTNGGMSWSALDIGLSRWAVQSLIINPRTPATIYLSAWPVQWGPGQPGPYRAYSGGGVLKSNDGGKNWYPVNDGLPIMERGTGGPAIPLVASLAIDPQAPSTLYAANKAGVFKTTNGGRKWRAVLGRPATEGVDLTTVVVDPQTPATIYVGAAGSSSGSSGSVFKSIDGGEHWSTAGNAGFTFPNVRILAIDPRTPTTLFAAADVTWSPYPAPSGQFAFGGLFKSTDSGDSWHPLNTSSVNTPRVFVLAIDPSTPTTIYAGSKDGGVFRSSDGGGSWRSINVGLSDVTTSDFMALVIDPRTATTIYIGWSGSPYGVPSGIYKSNDAGNSWFAINAGLPDSRFVQTLAIAPSAPTTLYVSLRFAGTHDIGVYKTTDGGKTWTLAGQSSSIWEILEVDPRTPDIVYASGADSWEGSGIFKSTDGGITWRAINTGLSNLHVNALAIDPQTPTTLYLGTRDWRGQAHGGVFKSTDGGNIWHAINAGLTDFTIWALAIDPKTPSTIYATTLDGVFVLRQ